jgi:aerobic carbon-monoxide dehydrogenase medium subunit
MSLEAELALSAPTTVAEALEALADEDAIAIGGGTSLVLLMKNGLVEPGLLVSLSGIAALSGISVDDGALRIGATTTLREIARSPDVAAVAPSLGHAASVVGNPRVRAAATLGGALAHGDPRQDLPPVALALGGSVEIASALGDRSVPTEEFFLGFMETACGEDELITALSIPIVAPRRSHYERFNPGSEDDYPTVGVAAALDVVDGIVSGARIALGGVGERPLLVAGVDALLEGHPGDEALEAAGELAAGIARPSDDRRGSAEYKLAMVRVMVRRAVTACLSAGF